MIPGLRLRPRSRCSCIACTTRARPPRKLKLRGAVVPPVGLMSVMVALLFLASFVVPQARETRGAIADWSGFDLARAAAASVPTEWPAAEPVQWRESTAHGTANTGHLDNGVRLPARGQGYYTYDPRFPDRRPNAAIRRFGTDALVKEVIALGEWWATNYPQEPRLGIGDLSHRDGGSLDLHSSHENGLDVDIRLPRRDGIEGRANAFNYDRELTQALVDRLVERGVELVLIGPNLDLRGPGGVVVAWPAHDDHLHVRLPDPDGRGN